MIKCLIDSVVQCVQLTTYSAETSGLMTAWSGEEYLMMRGGSTAAHSTSPCCTHCMTTTHSTIITPLHSSSAEPVASDKTRV